MAAALLLWRQLDASMQQRSQAPAGTRIQVRRGQQPARGAKRAGACAGAAHPRLVEWYLRLHGEPVRAQAGIYELAPAASAREILDQLRAGRVVLSQVTIVEGWSFAQMRQALDASGDLVHEWRAPGRCGADERAGPQGRSPPKGAFFRTPTASRPAPADRRHL